VGSGRTNQQEQGGLGTSGSGGYGGGNDDYDDSSKSGSKKQDSTAGKLMEKAGAIFNHKGMQEKGQAKREEAGAFDDSTGGSGGYGDNTSGGYGQGQSQDNY